jgi:hypothetical protein
VRSIAAEQKPGSRCNTESISPQRKFINPCFGRYSEMSDHRSDLSASLADRERLHTMKRGRARTSFPRKALTDRETLRPIDDLHCRSSADLGLEPQTTIRTFSIEITYQSHHHCPIRWLDYLRVLSRGGIPALGQITSWQGRERAEPFERSSGFFDKPARPDRQGLRSTDTRQRLRSFRSGTVSHPASLRSSPRNW